MQLSKLEICGFKSFADRTVFDFQPGITAVVGPNGCGKSNVVDAVRWILGSQSPKALRGAEMMDVIFSGTESRRGAGYAEASLTILNNKGLLPTDYAEVRITRRLYRTGESEYLLNNQPVRLKDIRNLLRDTGIGVDNYSLIEQGKVDRFLQSNPTERRVLFEEAAGVSGYKAQRKEAETRLERARLNLERVNDVIAEKERQLRSIKYQAGKARRHRELSDHLRELSVTLAQREFNRLTRLRRECLERVEKLEAEVRRWSEEISACDEEHRRLESVRGEHEVKVTAREQELHKLENDRRAAEERIQGGRARLEDLDTSEKEAAQRIGSLRERQERADGDRTQALTDLEEIHAAVQEQTEAVNVQVAAAREAAMQREGLEASIEEWKKRVVDILQKAAALRNEITHIEGSRRQDASRRSRLLTREEELGYKITDFGGQVDGELRKLAEARHQAADLEERRERDEIALGTQAAALAQLNERVNDLRTRHTSLASRRDTLQEMESRGEGVEKGVVRLLQCDEAGEHELPGVRGMVADLLHVQMPHAAALEAALGERAQFVVMERTEDARRALTLLRGEKWGRAGVLPLDRVVARESAGAELMGHPGLVGRAMDLVACSPDVIPAARTLLRDTMVVSALDDAITLSRNGGAGLRYVTLTGELVEPGGALVGGGASSQVGLVSRHSEMAAIEAEVAGLDAQLTGICGEAEVLERDTAGRRRAIEALAGEITRLERAIAQHEGTVTHLRRQCDRLEEERKVIRSEVQEIDRNICSCLEREEAIRAELAEAERREEQLHGEVRAAEVNLQRQRERVEELSREVTELRVKLAQQEEKQGALQGRVRRLAGEIEEMLVERQRVEEQIESYRQRRRELEEQLSADRERILELQLEAQRQQQVLEDLHAERAHLREQQREVEVQIRSRRDQLEAVQEALQRQRIAENEHRVRISSIEDRIREEYEVTLTLEEPAAAAEERDWDAVREEIAALQDQLRRLGPVNLESISQQEELEAGVAFRIQQRDDLITAEKELLELIQRLNHISRERFETTFNKVRENFREIFRKLFGGGKADIILEEGAEDILEAGIDIVASPPEKELRSINLMSGGEKTMTTIALLFAILKSKPSPFCILDEVDAALDEANVGRFAAIVRDSLLESQFIVITHNKRTMCIADVLYGITMEEKGVSKKVAVRLDQAEEMVA